MANNTLPEDITKTINDIIEELDAFSANVKTEYTLAGSVAVYLFVYSLYVNEEDVDKKIIIKRELDKLPKPNDIDIIIYTQGRLPKDKLSAYKKKKPKNGNNNNIPALNSVDGLPIIRKETHIFKIDLITINLQDPTKKVDDSIPLIFIHNGIKKTFSIVHPQRLISLYAPDENRGNKQTNNSIKRNVLEELNKIKLLPKKENPVSRYAARASSIRGLSFGNENSPSSARSSMRRMSFGKGNSPNSPSSATKRKRNSGNLSTLPFGNSPPQTKKQSVTRRFSFGSKST